MGQVAEMLDAFDAPKWQKTLSTNCPSYSSLSRYHQNYSKMPFDNFSAFLMDKWPDWRPFGQNMMAMWFYVQKQSSSQSVGLSVLADLPA